MIATSDGGTVMVICNGVDHGTRIRALMRAVKQFEQSLFTFSDPVKIKDVKRQIETITKSIRTCGVYEILADPCPKMPDDFEIHDQIFNPARLIPLKSQTHRKAFKGVSGCPPIRHGVNWGRKGRL